MNNWILENDKNEIIAISEDIEDVRERVRQELATDTENNVISKYRIMFGKRLVETYGE